MRTPRRLVERAPRKSTRRVAIAVLCVALPVGLGSCSRPEANPDIRISGDRSKAVPETTTTSTTTTEAPTTTLYYSDPANIPQS
jgi:hypothetical protein